jgi:hypothetical protein
MKSKLNKTKLASVLKKVKERLDRPVAKILYDTADTTYIVQRSIEELHYIYTVPATREDEKKRLELVLDLVSMGLTKYD